MEWTRCSHEFMPDGSLRDIYVRGTTIQEWEQFYQFLIKKGFMLTYSRSDRSVALLPHQAIDIFKDKNCVHTLTINLHGLLLNCHFFTEHELELDLDPKDINSRARLELILGFMQEIGRLLQKEVIMTPENFDHLVLFHYIPNQDVIIYKGNQG